MSILKNKILQLGKFAKDNSNIFLLDRKVLFVIFLNDVDIQLILEFKNSFRKYHPVCPKILKGRFFGTPCINCRINVNIFV